MLPGRGIVSGEPPPCGRSSLSLLVLWALAAGPMAAQTQPSLSATPSALTFTYQTGGALPAAQKVVIKRSGSGNALDFTVTVPASAPWLIVTPLTAKTGTSISVQINPTSLTAGSYSDSISIDAAGSSGPVAVAVAMLIKNPPPAMAVSTSAITFDYKTDQTTALADQTISVSTSGEPVSFTVSASSGAWMSVSPSSGIAVSGSPVNLTVKVNTAGLLPGSYTGKVTVTSPNASNKSLTANVTLTVTAGTAVLDSIWPVSAPVGSADSTITVSGKHFFKTSSVQAGTASLTATWISTEVLLAVIPQSLLASQTTHNITVTNSPNPASNIKVFTVTKPGPIVQGIANAASFAAYTGTPPIAPGEIISIFGSGLGPSSLLAAAPSGGAYPATLGSPATTVEFELNTGQWTAAPLIFAQANQVNCVVPFAAQSGKSVKMRVTYNALVSDLFSVQTVDAEPGIFTIDSSGRGQGAILNYNETSGAYSLNSSSNPAAKGTTIVVYATGGGVTTPLPSPEGQVIPIPAQGASPPALAGAVSVSIAGEGASVLSATAVAGSIAGLVQLNVLVPSTLKAGKALAVVITIGGRSSPATAMVSVK